jgi:anti-sigma28 factor (negative regulator of flagellin synthesis)
MVRIGTSGVDNLGSGNVGPVGGANPEGRSLAAAAGTSSKADSVTLSSAAGLVALAKSSASSASQSKLQSLSAQVKSGSYEADLGQISRAVVQSHITS